jgi:hypothetical protein
VRSFRHGRARRTEGRPQSPRPRARTRLRAVGGRVVNLAHVASVELPVAGDPKKPLTAHFAQGGSLSLSGADADAVLAAPGDCCDVTPAKPEKPAPATPAKPEKVDKGDKAG